MGVDFRQRGLIYPGQVEINWRHPITKDLAYFRILDSLSPTPKHSRFGQNCAISGSGAPFIAGTPGGIGMTAASTGHLSDSASNYTLTNRHSCFAFVTAFWSPTDSVSHCAVEWNGASNNGAVEQWIIKHSDNNWYLGMYDGLTGPTDYRSITAASGTFTSGVPFVAGYTLVINGNTIGFVAGKQLNTHASRTTLPATTGGFFKVGAGDDVSAGGAIRTWSGDSKSCVHWAALWDRDLNIEEISYLNFNPWCFLQSKYRAASVKFPVGRYYYDMGQMNV